MGKNDLTQINCNSSASICVHLRIDFFFVFVPSRRGCAASPPARLRIHRLAT
jgi:hypothetical protein